jgi:hypothetical protein
MTMVDKKCDVCRTGQAIGVASTIMPYSCAYCKECCLRFAQPLIVFECFWEDVGTDFARLREGIADELETYDCGRYQTYREWATRRAGHAQYNGRTSIE